jgi:SAM-dependent methyltransferase
MMELADTALTPDERAALLYYDFPGKIRAALPTNDWHRALRGIMRGEEWMLRHIVERKPRRFAEVGAGLGTWCYLAGIAGMPEVYGIDIFSRYLAPAIRLAPTFNEFTQGQSKATFLLEDIYDLRWDEPIDVFYMKATIHHVYPLAPLFDYLWENLSPGGVVIVHDPNGMNALSQYDALKRRGLKLRATYTDPVRGKTVTMANEDLLTVPGVLLRFKRRGFEIVHEQYHMGFRSIADDWWYYNVVQPMSGVRWLGAFVAPTYTIVARKPAR